MKTITKFIADNGQEFYTESDAIEADNLINSVGAIMDLFPPKPSDDGCRFSNGYSFIQHDPVIVSEVKNRLLLLIKKYIDHHWVDQTLADDKVHLSYVSRLIGENYRIKPINDAWYRLECIDKEFREWGQPYFAAHPEESYALKNTVNA